MYAIIKDGGKDYKVSPGKTIEVEKRDAAKGDEIVFDTVVYYKDGEDIQVGTPSLAGMKVKAIVEEQFKAPKVLVFRYRRRKDSRKKRGHRQQYTKVRIQDISKS